MKRDHSPLGRTVFALERAYAFLISLALTQGARQLLGKSLVESKLSDWPCMPNLNAICLFVALAITIIPFYHGANKHLDEVYRFYPPSKPPAPRRLLSEFLLLFIEAVLFFFLADFIHYPYRFSAVVVALFVTDCLWSWFWVKRSPTQESRQQVRIWFRLSFWAGLSVLATLLIFRLFPISAWWLGPAVLVVLAIRTLVDYLVNAKRYFDPAPPEALDLVALDG